jgi:cell division protein FtsB
MNIDFSAFDKLFAAFEKDGVVHTKWNSLWIGVPLWIISACLCLHWYFTPPSPGKAIGALAVVAGIMSVREMKVLGRILWVALLVFLLIAEFHAIDKDRTENQESQKKFFEAQQQGFDHTAQQAAHNFAATTQTLATSISDLDALLTTTQQVANLAQTNLLNLTGGNSFAYVIPGTALIPGVVPANAFSVTLVNQGKYPLTGLSVAIAHVLDESFNGSSLRRTDLGLSTPYDAGSLQGKGQKLLPYHMEPLRDDPRGNPHYAIEINAQNGEVREDLWLKPGVNGVGWAYKFVVKKLSTNPSEMPKPLLERDWVQPSMMH